MSHPRPIIAWIVLLVIGPCRATAVELRAGVARVDLTPPLGMKAPLGGYGERMNRPAEGVHDRIFAKALVVSDGTRKFALVTADLLGFAPAFKPAVVERSHDQPGRDSLEYPAELPFRGTDPREFFLGASQRGAQRPGDLVLDYEGEADPDVA